MRPGVAVSVACTVGLALIVPSGSLPPASAETKESTVAGRSLNGWAADLNNPDAVTRLRAVRSLQCFEAAAVPQLTAALRDQDAGVRAAAACALGELGPLARDAHIALRRLLDERSGADLYVAFALCRLGDRDRALAVLCEALGHSTRGVATTAAELLGRAEVTEALPALTRALAHSDYHVQGAATHAIARIHTTRDKAR
jgi:HEAT repeat protein